jgi:hypothetical protein
VLHGTMRAVWRSWPIIQEQSRVSKTAALGEEIQSQHGFSAVRKCTV